MGGEFLAVHAAAFTLGAAHALEVDHMVAVSAFVGGRPEARAAVGFGLRWGIGHSAVVLLAGSLLAISGLTVPASWNVWGELLVGATLMVLGIWALVASRRLHLHTPHDHGGHAHLHAHAPHEHPHHHEHADPDHRHRHLSSLVGAVHGLAGTAPVVALVPVTLMATRWWAFTYLAAFGVGTTLAMAGYAALAALAIRRTARTVELARWVARLTAVASLGVGAWWVVRVVTG